MPKPAIRPRRTPANVRRPFLFKPVPRLWPGETFVIVASGPSLTQEDVDFVRGKARVIAINESFRMAPWADALYCCDARMWKWLHADRKRYGNVHAFTGLKFALTKDSAKWPNVRVLQNTGPAGLEPKPNGLRTGRNSGYQAINLAVHLGAQRVLLLGYDMQRTGGKEHWHEDHPNRTRSPYPQFRQSFAKIVEPLKAAGVEVINCSRETALECFPRMCIQDALKVGSEAAA